MPEKTTKWIIVTGGVISTLGKGIVAGSLGALLKMRGYKVTAVKIDPYINVDAGTMRPTEHGEVFVTFDGGETDQDIGNYERFLDENIPKNHNITTGQVYLEVIKRERNLEYDGKCVEVIPHIPLEVQRRLRKAADDTQADYVIVEIGGTIGDYQNVLFLEAVRTMRLKGEPMIFAHVTYLPIPRTAGEMKSKPAQHSLRALNANGIQADFVIARSDEPIDEVRKEKISVFGNVKKEHVISCQDLESIYDVPLLLQEQKFDELVVNSFHESPKPLGKKFSDWKALAAKSRNGGKEVKIGVIGKYFNSGDFTLEDSYISVIEAIKHAAYNNDVKPVIQWINSLEYEKSPEKLEGLKEYDALIIPGGFGKTGVEGKISAIKYAREENIPFLGLCYGLQLAVIEHARNVINIKDANSAEIDMSSDDLVIDVLPEQKKNLEAKNYGASMRLGNYEAVLKKGTRTFNLYGEEKIFERHRHRYEVNPEYKEKLEKKGLVFSGLSPEGKLVEFIERSDHPFFIATQAHPEFTSRPLNPNPLFDGLVKAALKK